MTVPVISIEGATVVESSQSFPNLVFTVTLSEPATSSVTVDYRTVQGSGTARDHSIDYYDETGRVTFSAGETSKTITVQMEGRDTIDETDESVVVELINPSNGSFLDDAVSLRATGFVLDDDGDVSDAGSRALMVSDLQVTESDSGGRQAVFELLLSRSSNSTITVPYSTVDGSAIAGEDYVAAAGNVVFAPGETRQVVSVDLIGDGIAESTEFFSLVTTPPSSIASGADGAVGVAEVLDDDTSPGLPEISITGARVFESAESFPNLVFTVTLSEPAASNVTVDYRTVQGSGTARDHSIDYYDETGRVTFSSGETSKTITVQMEGRDTIDETDESVIVELINPSNGAFPEAAITLRATGFVLDDDGDVSADGSRALMVSDLQITESDSGGRQAVFELLLSRPSDSTITVPYNTVDGSAIAGEDYVAAAGNVVFAPGETRQAVSVDLIGDSIAETAEFFSLVTTPPPSIASGAAGAVGIAEILDDDTSPGLPEISISGARVFESSESFPNLVFTVTLSEPAASNVTVDYRTVQSGGSARDHSVDYYDETGRITFSSGETSKIITVQMEGRDTIDETDESVVVELINPSNGAFPEDAITLRATGFVLDDDGDVSADGSRALMVSNLQITESDDAGRQADFELLLSRPSDSTITVPYSTVDGSAIAGEDYVAAAGNVVFAPGETRQVVSVDLVGDTTAESAEFFSLVTTPPPSIASGAAGAVGIAEILDDDTSPGLPEISITGARVFESSESFPNLVFTVTLSEPAASNVTVDYRTVQSGGTALDHSVDYYDETGRVTFSSGETSKTITVQMEGRNTIDETDESVIVELINPSNGAFPEAVSTLRATGFVLDDDGDVSDAGSRALMVSNLQITESAGGGRQADFELLLSRPADSIITLPYSTVDGSAIAGQDYVAAAGNAVFAPGETRQVVSVDLLGDTTVEGTEFFSLVTTPPPSIASGAAGAVGIAEILDDDTSPGLPEISITGGRVVESAESFPNLVFTVSLSEPAASNVTVEYRTVQGGGTAQGESVDYFDTARRLTFTSGETSKTINVQMEGRDTLDETDESVVVELFDPEQAVFSNNASSIRATGFVLDDDGDVSDAGSIALRIENALPVLEGDGAQAFAAFQVLLSRPAAQEIVLNYSPVSGTAVAGVDFDGSAGQATIRAGQDRASILIPILGDSTVEDDETFSLTIGNTSAVASIETTQAVATILNDDAPSLSFQVIDPTPQNPLFDAFVQFDDGSRIDSEDFALYRTYGGALGRVPDLGGFLFWDEEIDSGRRSVEQMTLDFLFSPEFLGFFPGATRPEEISSADFVTHMYQNVFGRAPDPGGFAFWVGELDSGARDKTNVVINMTASDEYVALTAQGVVDFFDNNNLL